MSEQASGIRDQASGPTRDSPVATSRRSLIPFSAGDQVIEAIGPMGERTHDLVTITEHGDDHCVTSSGHVYTRRGTSIPRDDELYRSIISPDYYEPEARARENVGCASDLTTSPAAQDAPPPGATDGHDAGQT
jgi:hypothetical protein